MLFPGDERSRSRVQNTKDFGDGGMMKELEVLEGSLLHDSCCLALFLRACSTNRAFWRAWSYASSCWGFLHITWNDSPDHAWGSLRGMRP
jgi:hypothetical protein